MCEHEMPGMETVEAAFRAALSWRLRDCAGDGRYALLSEAALRERVVILPGQPSCRAGWWSVGALIDDVAHAEWTVWMHPERRVLRLLPRRPPEPAIPPRMTRADGRYYEGMRRRWLLPDGSLAGDGTDLPLPA